MIRAGDEVVDLACGPANLLCQVARLNPQAHFVGIDLAGNMLERAQDHAQRQRLTNIRFMHGDITRLTQVAGQSATWSCPRCRCTTCRMPDGLKPASARSHAS